MAKEEKEKKVKKVKETKEVEVKEEHECACGKDCKCKKGKVGRVFFVVGLVIVLCAVSFAVGMVSGAKFIYDEDMIEEVDNEEKEETEFDMTKVEEELLKRVEELAIIDSYNRSFDSTDNLSNIELLNFGFRLALGWNWDQDTVVTLDDVNAIVKEYFGKTVVGEDVPCDITVAGKEGWNETHPPMFVYNEDKKNFTYNQEHYGHGGLAVDVLNRVVDVSVDGELYTIKVKKAIAVSEFFFAVYYPTYQDAYQGTNVLFEAPECDDYTVMCGDYDPTEDFNNTPDSKMFTFKYVFEKTEDGYILKDYSFSK